MSREIDEKIVSMKFQNEDFEAKAEQSISTIERLKEHLKFKKAREGFDDVTDGAEKAGVQLNRTAQVMSFAQAKYVASVQAIQTAVGRLTGSLIDLAKNTAKAFTIEPIHTGLQEYETQIGSIQTILANTSKEGTTLNQVNDALDELNTYADKTIYNFTQMTKNIGTFTAAGVKLDTSVGAIKGIANLAAVSGSTSTQASTAMYQLSQALATGQVKLQDWNSVVNAGMGGKTFQDALVRTATAMERNNRAYTDMQGVTHKYADDIKNIIANTSKFDDAGAKTVEDIIKISGSFRESLTTGEWLTTDVLLETLNQFAGVATAIDSATLKAQGYTEEEIADIQKMAKTAEEAATKVRTFTQLIDTLKEAAQSGWTQTWEYLLGDFSRSTKLFTSLSDFFSDILGSSAERRNKRVGDIMLSGWEKVRNAVTDTGISAALYEEQVTKYAKKTGVDVDGLVKKYGTLDESMQDGWMTTKIAYEGIARLYQYLKTKTPEELKDLGVATENMKELKQLTIDAKAYKLPVVDTKPIVDLLYNVKDRGGWEILYSSLKNILDGLGGIFDRFGERVDKVTAKIFNSDRFIKVFSKIEELSEKFKKHFMTKDDTDTIEKAVKGSENFFDIVKKIFDLFKSIGKAIYTPIKFVVEFVKSIMGSLSDLAKSSSWFKSVSDWFKSLRQNSKIGFLDWLTESITSVDDFTDKMNKSIDVIKKWREDWKGTISSAEDFRTAIEEVLNSRKKVFNPDADQINLASLDAKISKFFTGIFGKNGIIRSNLKKAGKYISSTITKSRVFENIRTWFVNSFDGVKSFFDSIFSNIGGKAKEIYENISGYIYDLIHNKTKISDVFSTIKTWISKIDIHSFFGAFSSFKDSVKVGGDKIATFFKNISTGVVKFIDTIHQHITDLGLGNIAGILFGISSLLGVKSLKNFGDAVGDFGESVSAPLAGMAGVLAEVKDTLKTYQRELNSEAIKELAEAVALLAGSMWLISKIDDDKFSKAAITLGSIIAALIGVNAALGFMSKKLPIGSNGLGAKLDKSGLSLSGNTSVASNMFVLAKSLVSIARAFKIMIDAGIGDMPWDKIGKIMVAMGGALIEVGGLAVIIGRLSNINIKQSISTLILSWGLDKMLDLFDRIAAFNPDKVIENIESFITIYGLLYLTMASTQVGGENPLPKSFSLIIIEGAIALMAEVIKKLAEVPWDIMVSGGLKVLAIEGLLALWEVIDALIGNLRKSADMESDVTGGAGLFIGLAFSIYAMAVAIEKLSGIDKPKLQKAVEAMSQVLLSLGGILLVAHDTGKAWTAVLSITAFLSVFAIVASIFSSFSYEQLDKIDIVTNSMVKILASVALVLKAASGLIAFNGDKDTGVKGVLGLVMGLFAEIAIVIGVLSFIVKDANKLDSITNAIVKVMSAIAGIIYVIHKTLVKKVGKNLFTASYDKKDVGLIIALFSAISALTVGVAAGLMAVSNVVKNAKTFSTVGDTISIVMGAIGSVVSVLLLEMPKIMEASQKYGAQIWVAFGLVSAVLGVVTGLALAAAAALMAISNKVQDASKFETVGTTMSIIFGVIGTIASILTPMLAIVAQIAQASAAGLFIGIAAILTIIAGIIVEVFAAVEIIGVLWRKFDWFKLNIEAFMDMIEFIADSVFKIKSKINSYKPVPPADIQVKETETKSSAEKLLEFGKSLETFGTNLSTFAENAKGLFDAIADLPTGEEFKQQIGSLAKVLGSIVFAEIGDSLATRIANGTANSEVTYLTNFSNSLWELAANLSAITKIYKENGIDLLALGQIASAFSLVTDIDITNGDKLGADIVAYSSHLGDFATHLVTFYNGLSEIKEPSKLATFARVTKNLAEAANLIPVMSWSDSGIKSWGIGIVNLDEFGKGLKKLADWLVQVDTSFDGVDAAKGSNIDKFATAVERITTSTKDIDPMGGIWGVIKGNNDPETFAAEVETLANSFKVLDSVGGLQNFKIHMENIAAGIGIITGITFPTSGTDWTAVPGNIDTSKFNLFSGAMQNIGNMFGSTLDSNNLGNDYLKAMDEWNSEFTSDATIAVEEAEDKTRATTNDMLAFVTILDGLASAITKLETAAEAIDLDAVGEIPRMLDVIFSAFQPVEPTLTGPIEPTKLTSIGTESLTEFIKSVDLKSLDSFVGDMTSLGTSLYTFCSSTYTYDTTPLKDFGTALAILATSLPTDTSNIATFATVSATDEFGIFTDRLGNIAGKLKTASDKGKDISSVNIENFTAGLKAIGETFDGSKVDWDKVNKQKYDKIKTSLTEVSGLASAIDIDAFSESKLMEVGTGIASLVINSAAAKNPDAIAVGATIAQSIADGAYGESSYITGKISSLFSTIFTDNESTAKSNGSSLGFKMGDGIGAGILGSKTSISSRLSSVLSSIGATYSGTSSSTYTYGKWIGECIMDGLAAGINGKANVTVTFASQVDKTLKAGAATANVGSPSKRTMELGGFISEGLEIGILSREDRVIAASSHVVGSAINTIYSAVSSTNPNDYNLRISPVVDFGKTRQEISSINSDIAKQAQSVNADVTMAAKSKIAVEFENAAAIKNLSKQLTAMADNTASEEYLRTIADNSRKNIYLNGKALVGELAPDIDETMGRRTIQRLRRS